MYSRSQKMITPEIAVQRARLISRGVSVFEDRTKKLYLVFSTSVFPVDWLTTVYNLDGKRYDIGWGDGARTVFMFPHSEKNRVLSSLSVLRSAETPRAHIRGQANAPKPIQHGLESIYRPLIPA